MFHWSFLHNLPNNPVFWNMICVTLVWTLQTSMMDVGGTTSLGISDGSRSSIEDFTTNSKKTSKTSTISNNLPGKIMNSLKWFPSLKIMKILYYNLSYIWYVYNCIYLVLDSGFPEVPNTKVVSSCMLPQIWPVKLKQPNKKTSLMSVSMLRNWLM